jgi:hypothetical protein
MSNDNDLHVAHVVSTLAIMRVYETAMGRLTPEQCKRVREVMNGGEATLTLLVLNDGDAVHVELALTPKGCPRFDNALLRLDGPATTPATSPEDVTVVNRASMN